MCSKDTSTGSGNRPFHNDTILYAVYAIYTYVTQYLLPSSISPQVPSIIRFDKLSLTDKTWTLAAHTDHPGCHGHIIQDRWLRDVHLIVILPWQESSGEMKTSIERWYLFPVSCKIYLCHRYRKEMPIVNNINFDDLWLTVSLVLNDFEWYLMYQFLSKIKRESFGFSKIDIPLVRKQYTIYSQR